MEITLRCDVQAERRYAATQSPLDRGLRERFSDSASLPPGRKSPADHRPWPAAVACEFGLLPNSQTFCMRPDHVARPRRPTQFAQLDFFGPEAGPRHSVVT